MTLVFVVACVVPWLALVLFFAWRVGGKLNAKAQSDSHTGRGRSSDNT